MVGPSVLGKTPWNNVKESPRSITSLDRGPLGAIGCPTLFGNSVVGVGSPQRAGSGLDLNPLGRLRGWREWRVASGEWRVASGEWRVASGEWRVASGEWRVASGEWRVASGEWRVASGEWRVASGEWRVASGEWRVASGEWRVASGEWRVASGEWRVASGEWRVASGEWRVASGEWREKKRRDLVDARRLGWWSEKSARTKPICSGVSYCWNGVYDETRRDRVRRTNPIRPGPRDGSGAGVATDGW